MLTIWRWRQCFHSIFSAHAVSLTCEVLCWEETLSTVLFSDRMWTFVTVFILIWYGIYFDTVVLCFCWISATVSCLWLDCDCEVGWLLWNHCRFSEITGPGRQWINLHCSPTDDAWDERVEWETTCRACLAHVWTAENTLQAAGGPQLWTWT